MPYTFELIRVLRESRQLESQLDRAILRRQLEQEE
jgi:hypothetical protein